MCKSIYQSTRRSKPYTNLPLPTPQGTPLLKCMYFYVLFLLTLYVFSLKLFSYTLYIGKTIYIWNHRIKPNLSIYNTTYFIKKFATPTPYLPILHIKMYFIYTITFLLYIGYRPKYISIESPQQEEYESTNYSS